MPPYEIEPHTYDITTLTDDHVVHITKPSIPLGRTYTLTSNPWNSLSAWPSDPTKVWTDPAFNPHENSYAESMLYGQKEDIPNMITSDDKDHNYIVSCQDERALSAETILKTLSIMKGKLEIDCAAIRVKNIECYMSPAVKTNIIKAGKRAAMYGKPRPFVARFDEYGNKLPDEISIDTSKGMTLKIIDPSIYGEFYFSLKAINNHNTTSDFTTILPF